MRGRQGLGVVAQVVLAELAGVVTEIVKVAGLKSPFDIVIDDQNRVWVSNSQSDKVVRFSANDPSKVEDFQAGISVRALALDSKGNVWVASNASKEPHSPSGLGRRCA
jgi:Two component regulator propeller